MSNSSCDCNNNNNNSNRVAVQLRRSFHNPVLASVMTALSYSPPPLRSHPHDIPIIRYCRSDHPIDNELDKNSHLTFYLKLRCFFLSFFLLRHGSHSTSCCSFIIKKPIMRVRKKEPKKPELECNTPRHDPITTCK
jgi:hypothetical protein